MTLKEAVLKSLEDMNDITIYLAVLSHINDKNYYDFGGARTPGSTVSAVLGDFIRNGDIKSKENKTRRWNLLLLRRKLMVNIIQIEKELKEN